MLKDSNASALDSALRLAFGYLDFCEGGCNPEQVTALATSIVTGPALAATRPSSAKLTDCTLMKMMEVSRGEPSSIHTVVELLLTHGITSRKPKVVMKSVAMILEAAKTFGAATLPLSKVSSSAPKMLSHVNGTVRDNGIQILAEICRAVGSKDALSNVIEAMKSAQVAELDQHLSKQPDALPPSVGLRYVEESSSTNALDDLQAGSEADAAQRLAARKAVNLFEALRGSEYKEKMKQVKWSEKVAALDILLKCGGEKPYKLAQPSSSANYVPLISELKKLLKHTHFAVKSKTIAAINMICEGVGEKLFAHLKPMLSILLNLCKDKKVTKASQNGLDVLFGNIIGFSHLIDKEDGLPPFLNEKKEKSTIVRQISLSFLLRCIERCDSAGPRGYLDEELASNVANLCVDKTKDSDSGVRKEAIAALKGLLNYGDEGIQAVAMDSVGKLERDNPRAYKSLMSSHSQSSGSNRANASPPRRAESRPPTSSRQRTTPEKIPATAASTTSRNKATPKRRSNLPSSFNNSATTSRRKSNLPNSFGSPVQKKKSAPVVAKKKTASSDAAFSVDLDESNMPNVDDATEYMSSLDIQGWSDHEEEDGVFSGLQSTNWKFRKGAIESLIAFTKTEQAREEGMSYVGKVVVLVKHYTKEFKESNFNVLKAAASLFLAICDLLEKLDHPMDNWICNDAVFIAVSKIADKKYSTVAGPLLYRLCEVQLPEIILHLSISTVNPIKSPLPHEGLLTWANDFCKEFGAASIGKCLTSFISWVLKECESSNVKVKATAISLVGEMYKQLGPVMKAMIASVVTKESLKAQMDKTFDSCPYDSSLSAAIPQKKCLARNDSNSNADGEGAGLDIEIPKADLLSELSPDIISQMGAKVNKDSWKLRKAALEEVEGACEQYKGIISTSPDCMKGLTDLIRALNSRLSDSQSNLKPIAARNISSILNSIDATSQAKLGKLVYSSLIHAGMSDNKKITRDAAIEALIKGTLQTELDGGGVNPTAMEPLIAAFASEVEDSEYKAVGLPDILHIMIERSDYFPTLTSTTSKGRTILTQFSKNLVGCLTSNKSETRSLAETLLNKCIDNGVLNFTLIEKSAQKLKPVEQGKVKPVLESFRGSGGAQVSRAPSRASTQGRPRTRAPSRASSTRSRSRTPAPQRSHSRASTRSGRTRERNLSTTRARSRSSVRSRPMPTAGYNDLDELLDDPSFHPMKARTPSNSNKRQRAMRQREHIPEYPEEPTSKDAMQPLRKSWSPLLPPATVDILFPQDGISKQDDASPGCDLLIHAMSLVKRDGEEDLFIEQLDLIIRWFLLAFCCRDTTSGLESLLSFLTQMLSLVRDQGYQLSDSECSMLVPYVLEKAGVAKGRFRDKMRELIDFFTSGEIYPSSKYGSIVCVSVLEKSSNSKTRVIAANGIQDCVDSCGLPGVGKKGLQLIAKAFSDETMPENKAAYLDAIEAIVDKMNGDTNKYFKVCGSTNLSRNAKEAIEKRINSGSSNKSMKRQSVGGKALRRPLAPSDVQRVNSSPQPDMEQEREFPALDLQPSTDANEGDMMNAEAVDGPFTFSFQSNSRDDGATSTQPIIERVGRTSLLPDDRDSNSGAAASLRERLKHIRDKHRQEVDITGVGLPISTQESSSLASSCPLYDEIVKHVNILLSEPTPLREMNAKFTNALIGLRQFHSSLSNNNSDSTGTDPKLLQDLRKYLHRKVPECVGILTRVLEFGFQCGTPVHPQALSVPLLSVSIAGLMAIFLDAQLASQVSEKTLSLVIHRGTVSLLDRRLSAASDSSGLDASTCKKMVKAINKLAIQASYGAKRHISIQTLISLQMKYCLSSDPSTPSDENTSSAHRMSRIITKLFSRVIKAEENEMTPFSSSHFDLGPVLKAMDKVLIRCQAQWTSASTITSAVTSIGSALDSYSPDDYMGPCKEMMNSFAKHILKSKTSQGKIDELRKIFDEVGLHSTSQAGISFSTCCQEQGLAPLFKTTSLPPIDPSTSYDVDYLSELIYAVGGAEEDCGRVDAMEDLRDYLDAHKEIDIEAHLSGVSAPFRKYILEQLKSPFRNLMTKSDRSLLSGFSSAPAVPGSSRSVVSEFSEGRQSMSEKLRFLKNKINATEARLSNSETGAVPVVASGPLFTSTPGPTSVPPITFESPASEVKPAVTIQSASTEPNSAMSSLRQRLAAAAVRANAKSPEAAISTQRPSLAVGNAAALRARLNSVKRMSSIGTETRQKF
uniref:TOG domain-containing protein n=1 Tax=Chaetoceros debilis TaxID=122233 RepID=A0A7S3Q8W0_9STRA